MLQGESGKARQLPRLDFAQDCISEEKCHGKCLKEHLSFFFSGEGGGGVGWRTESPSGFRAFPARNLPRLVLKPGYGPGLIVEVWTSHTT